MREETLFHILIALVTILVGSSSQSDTRTAQSRLLLTQRTLSVSPVSCECRDCFSLDEADCVKLDDSNEALIAPKNLGSIELYNSLSLFRSEYLAVPNSRGPPVS